MQLWNYSWYFENNAWHHTNFLLHEVGTNVMSEPCTNVPIEVQLYLIIVQPPEVQLISTVLHSFVEWSREWPQPATEPQVFHKSHSTGYEQFDKPDLIPEQ